MSVPMPGSAVSVTLLRQLLGAVLVHTEDRLPVVTVERDDPGLGVEGAFEQPGLLDELGFATGLIVGGTMRLDARP